MNMLTLGIETSGHEGAISLLDDDHCLAEVTLGQEGRRHAQSLVQIIHQTLAQHQRKPQDVNLVAVSKGPGSFTGLRVGMMCAKVFAYATGCAFVAVDTFAVIAANLSADESDVIVIDDGQRQDLFAGRYTRDGSGTWVRSAPLEIVSVERFVEGLSPNTLVIGPGTTKLNKFSPDGAWKLRPEADRPRAIHVAESGRNCFQNRSGQMVDDPDFSFWKASPFYLRQSAAEEKRNQQTQAGLTT